jgi:hypothetical protein
VSIETGPKFSELSSFVTISMLRSVLDTSQILFRSDLLRFLVVKKVYPTHQPDEKLLFSSAVE